MSQGEDLFGITYDKGEVIFQQGTPGDTMYIIQSGAVEISQLQGDRKKVLALLERGDFFGEMALIDKHPRTARATAISHSRLLPLTRISLMDRIRQDPGVVIHLLNTLCQRITQTNCLIQRMVQSDENLRSVLTNRSTKPLGSSGSGDRVSAKTSEFPSSEKLNARKDTTCSPGSEKSLTPSVDLPVERDKCMLLEKGEAIFHQSDPGDVMFIIVEGEVEISLGTNNDRHILARLGSGEFFGEMAIITDQPRTANASVTQQTLLLPIRKGEFLERIKAEPELALYILQGLIIRLRMMLSFMTNPRKSLNTDLRNPPPLLKKKSPTRTAVISLSTCGGCSAVLLEDQKELMQLLEKINISYCPMLIDEEEITDVDIALVDGIVRVKEDEEKLIEARHKCRYLIAWGTCAAFSGIPAYANRYELEELIEESYGSAKDPFAYYLSGTRGVDRLTYQEQEKELQMLRRARKLDDFVRVDYYLPGCPPNVSLLNQFISELRGDGQMIKPKPIVCAECSRKHLKDPVEYFWVSPKSEWGFEHCFTSKGSICLGFMTKGGCGAVCPRGGLPCWGCRGPSETVLKKMEEGNSFEDYMLNSLVNRHRHMEDQIKSVMRIFRKHANSSLKFNRYFANDRSRIR